MIIMPPSRTDATAHVDGPFSFCVQALCSSTPILHSKRDTWSESVSNIENKTCCILGRLDRFNKGHPSSAGFPPSPLLHLFFLFTVSICSKRQGKLREESEVTRGQICFGDTYLLQLIVSEKVKPVGRSACWQRAVAALLCFIFTEICANCSEEREYRKLW